MGLRARASKRNGSPHTTPMSEMGPSRRSDVPPPTSGLSSIADLVAAGRHVSKVPTSDMRTSAANQKKAAPKAALKFKPDDLDQAAINASFDFWRYAMKPTPAKPRIIMAQVEGSGTAATDAIPSNTGLEGIEQSAQPGPL